MATRETRFCVFVSFGFRIESHTDTSLHGKLLPGPVDNTVRKVSALRRKERHNDSTQEAFKINLLETFYKTHIV